MMNIDHLFIFTDDYGKVADRLVEFGLVEGSNRIHAGQGTTNRKFYFENFFLEILWIHNENEIKSDPIKPTGLWQRANYKNNNFSPYGICIVNEDETDKLFENAHKHQPAYFPAGMPIDIVANEKNPHLPWTFRLPFEGQKKNDTEPRNHPNGIKKLTNANFYYHGSHAEPYLNFFKNETQIDFTASESYALTLTFDHHEQNKEVFIEDLRLTIAY